MKTKTKKKLFGVFTAALCAAVAFVFTATPNETTTANAMGNTALQTLTGYESVTHKTSSDEYTEKNLYNTGIKIYGAVNNGASQSGNTIIVDCNAVCIDFSSANAFVTPKVSSGVVSATTQNEYKFEILQGDSVKWYANFVRSTYTKEVQEDGETVTKTYSKKTLNVNGKTSVITSENANYTTFVPSDFKTNATNLQDGTYTVKITRKFNWVNWHSVILFTGYNSVSELSGTLIVDTTAPYGRVVDSNNNVIKNGGYANKSISYNATDAGGVSYCQVKKPNSNSWTSYTQGTKLSSTGKYVFRSVDKAGNISEEYSVYYDATLPVGTLYGGTAVKQDGSYTNAEYIKYVAADGQSGIDACYVKMSNSSSYTNYASGTQLATEGRYYFYSIDKSGNRSSTVSIVLDKTKPVGIVSMIGDSGIKNGSYTNASWIAYSATDTFGIAASYVKKPDSSSFVSYSLGVSLSEEGEYTFYCVDKAGNRSDDYTVTIDRQVPTGEIRVDGKPFDGKYTNGENISFVCSAVKCFVAMPDSNAFTDYISGMEFYKPGRYNFYGVSKAGTAGYIYSITIDRTSKPLTVKNVTGGKTDSDVEIEWSDGDLSKFAPIKTVTVNGKEYKKGETIYTIEKGKYFVESIDAAGNVWRTAFVSDKQNVFTKTLKKEYFETNDLQDEDFAFASYESAYKFAFSRENSLVNAGEWKSGVWDAGLAIDEKDEPNAKTGRYFVYKSENNAEEKVAYFTEARLNEVVIKYAENSVKKYYFWQKEPAEAYAGENLYSETIVADKVELGDNICVYSDGEEFTGNEFSAAGKHTLTVRDEWNNSCDYAVIIVSRAPDILYSVNDGNENKVAFDRTYKLAGKVNVSVVDALDEAAMLCVYDEDENLLAVLSLGEKYTIDKSGEYSVVAVNRFGKSGVFSLSVTVENSDDTPIETPPEENPTDSGNGDVNDAKDSGSKEGLIIGLSAFGVACIGAVCFILVKKRREF